MPTGQKHTSWYIKIFFAPIPGEWPHLLDQLDTKNYYIASKSEQMAAFGKYQQIAYWTIYLPYSLLTTEDEKFSNRDKIWHTSHKWVKYFLYDMSNQKLDLEMKSKEQKLD